jgi:hypothetical protein
MGISSSYDKERLDDILRTQYNVVSRQQLVDCGMTRSAIQHRVRPGGPWPVILPGIYIASGDTTAERREMAALLYAGEGGIITGAFAVRHYGIVAPGPDCIEVLVPVNMRRRQSVRFVRLIHTTRMPRRTFLVGSRRIAAPPRAVADAVRGYRRIHDARSVICGAIQHEKCTLAELAEELREGPKRGSALLLDGLRDAATGIWSAAEGKLMDLINRSGLPEPEYNVTLYAPDGEFLGIVDAWWPEAGVAAEVDSQQFHFSRSDWSATMKRHNRIARYRVVLLHFAPWRIASEGGGVVSELRDAIAIGRTAPPPLIRAVPQRVNCANGTL